MGFFARIWGAIDRVVASLNDMASLVEGANAEIRARAALPAQEALTDRSQDSEPQSGVARKRKAVAE